MTEETKSISMQIRITEIAKAILARETDRIDFPPDDALVDLGFSSLDLANLMLAIESDFDLMIPASHLTPGNFQTINSITKMMVSILPNEMKVD